MPKPTSKTSGFKILKDETVYAGKFIEVLRRHYRAKSGEKKYWEMVKRTSSHKIVSIVGITPKKEIILIKIYRIPIKSYTIETVMGITDHKGEDLKLTAKRELLEETGYQVKNALPLIVSPHNSGLSAWPVYFFVGLNAKKIKKPKLESSEDISVIKIPIKKIIPFLLRPPSGIKVDIKVFGVLLLLAQKGLIKF